MMAAIAVSVVSVTGFGVVLWKSGIAPAGNAIVDRLMTGVSAILDAELDDHAKAAAVQRAGFGLIAGAFGLLWRFALALAAGAAPILCADAAGLTAAPAVLDMMMRLDYILITSVVALVLFEVLRRWLRPRRRVERSAGRYSTADRLFHEIAFASPVVLKAVSSLEDRLVSVPIRCAADRPIFITSLARAGTTALLNALHDVPGVITHVYRDMPFITAPILWNRVSGGDRRHVDRVNRAHDDGLTIMLDTPEAFEEVIWKTFWPTKYHKDYIELWHSTDDDAAAQHFLMHHINKIASARLHVHEHKSEHTMRYISKNNANIGRIEHLCKNFDRCKIVVPIRKPSSHVASLIRQHHNFEKIHEKDEFTRRYMRDIGHFEFGDIHKPILFPEFYPFAFDRGQVDYWLYYWVCAYEYVMTFRDNCIFVLQDDLRRFPQESMNRLGSLLELNIKGMRFCDYFHREPDVASIDGCDPALYNRAERLYNEFQNIAQKRLVS